MRTCSPSRYPTPSSCPRPGASSTSASGGELGHLIEDGELKGRLGKTTFVHTSGRLGAHRVAAAGVGGGETLDADALRTAAAAVAIRAGEVGGRSVAWILGEDGLRCSRAGAGDRRRNSARPLRLRALEDRGERPPPRDRAARPLRARRGCRGRRSPPRQRRRLLDEPLPRLRERARRTSARLSASPSGQRRPRAASRR